MFAAVGGAMVSKGRGGSHGLAGCGCSFKTDFFDFALTTKRRVLPRQPIRKQQVMAAHPNMLTFLFLPFQFLQFPLTAFEV